MKSIYEEIADAVRLSESIGSKAQEIGEDVSVIIGVADSKNEKVISLTAVGNVDGIVEMLTQVANHIIDGEEYDDRPVNENFS